MNKKELLHSLADLPDDAQVLVWNKLEDTYREVRSIDFVPLEKQILLKDYKKEESMTSKEIVERLMKGFPASDDYEIVIWNKEKRKFDLVKEIKIDINITDKRKEISFFNEEEWPDNADLMQLNPEI